MIEVQLEPTEKRTPVKIEPGAKFGRLTLLSQATPSKFGDLRWICRCECGVEKTFIISKLRSGITKSCGCLRSEQKRRQLTIHGMSRTPEYDAWHTMKGRCTNVNHKRYKDYGGRNILVCERWIESFENFLADMGLKPEANLTLERKDNNLGYSPENCVWDTRKAQANNRRITLWVEIKNQKMLLSDVAALVGIKEKTIRERYRLGDRGKRLLRPLRARS